MGSARIPAAGRENRFGEVGIGASFAFAGEAPGSGLLTSFLGLLVGLLLLHALGRGFLGLFFRIAFFGHMGSNRFGMFRELTPQAAKAKVE